MIAIVDDDKLISGILKKILLSKFPGEEVSVFPNDNSLITIIEANPLRGLIIRAENADESYNYPGLKLYEKICGKGGVPIPVIISFDSLEQLSAMEDGYLLKDEWRDSLFNYLRMPFRVQLLFDLLKRRNFK